VRKTILTLLLLLASVRVDASPVLRCELRGNENKPIQFSKDLPGWMHFILFSQQNGLRVFQEWNSWGYYARSFVATEQGKSYRIARRPGAWDKNAPTTHTLNRGEFLITDINLVDGTWSVNPKLAVRAYIRLNVTAEFQITKDADASAAGVWTGKIKSTPTEILLDQSAIERLNKI
jgi:hypothetical protein